MKTLEVIFFRLGKNRDCQKCVICSYEMSEKIWAVKSKITSEQNCCNTRRIRKSKILSNSASTIIWWPLKSKIMLIFSKLLIWSTKKKYLIWFRLFFYKHKDLEKHGKNTHLCTLDVERNNNVKFSKILVSFSNEKRINGKQNYFYLSYLCHRKKPIHIISNWIF